MKRLYFLLGDVKENIDIIELSEDIGCCTAQDCQHSSWFTSLVNIFATTNKKMIVIIDNFEILLLHRRT